MDNIEILKRVQEVSNKVDRSEFDETVTEMSNDITEINNKTGILSNLTTTDKGSVVGAVNELNSSLETKANKNEIFSMSNMGQDVKEAMTGGSVAVVGKDAVLTENIVDFQITEKKLKEVYNMCIISNVLGNWINFNFNEKKIIIPRYCYINIGTRQLFYNSNSDIEIDFSYLPINTGGRSLVFDLDSDSLRVIRHTSVDSKRMYLIANWWAQDAPPIVCTSPYLLNGKKVDNYGAIQGEPVPDNYIEDKHIKSNTISLDKIKEVSRLAFWGNALGTPIDFNFTTKIITVPVHSYIQAGGIRITYNGGEIGAIKVDWTNAPSNTRYFVFDLNDLTYKVATGSAPRTCLVIATWWVGTDKTSLTCYTPYYTIDGKKVDNYGKPLEDYVTKADLDNIDIGNPLDDFNELINIPLYKTPMYLVEGINTSVFLTSTFMGSKLNTIRALNPILTYLDKVGNSVFNDGGLIPKINTSDFSGKELSLRYNKGEVGTHYEKKIPVVYKKQSEIINKTPKVLMIGDSLTEWGTPYYAEQLMKQIGITPKMVGTYKDYKDTKCEGKGSWTWTNMIGRNAKLGVNDIAITQATANPSSGSNCAFWKVATEADKISNPDWCFKYESKNPNCKSYSELTDKTGTFYIFDMEYYLNTWGIETPDVITIAYGTNDLNLSYMWDKDVYELMELSLEIMVKQIRKVLPNVPIGIIPVPMRGGLAPESWNLDDKLTKWYLRCIDKVTSLRIENVEVLTVFPHMSRDYVWGLDEANTTELIHGVIKNKDSDTTHFREMGQKQFSSVVASYFANVIS